MKHFFTGRVRTVMILAVALAIVLIVVMLFTWSPKFKDLVAIAKAKLFGNKMKKEVGTNE